MKTTNKKMLTLMTVTITGVLVALPLSLFASGRCCKEFDGFCADIYTEEPCGEGNPNTKIVESRDADFILKCSCNEEKGYNVCIPFLTTCSYLEYVFNCDGTVTETLKSDFVTAYTTSVIQCPTPDIPPT